MAIAKFSGKPKEEKLYTQEQVDKLVQSLKDEIEDTYNTNDADAIELNILNKKLKFYRILSTVLGGICGYYIILHL